MNKHARKQQDNSAQLKSIFTAVLIALTCSQAPAWSADDSEMVESAVALKRQMPGQDPELQKALVKHLLKRFYSRIDASSAQRKEISQLVDERMVANESKREAMRAGLKEFLQMSATLDGSNSSNTALKEKAHQLRVAHAALNDDRLETFLKIRALLSDEQKQKLQKTCQNRFRRISALPLRNDDTFVTGELL
jgi:hypothetical protein